MTKSKPSTPFSVVLKDGSSVVVLARSKKGAASYAAQVAGLDVDPRERPAPLDHDRAGDAVNHQEARV